MLRQRELVLIPVPFTDLSSRRRRPVIIVSSDTYNSRTDDIIVVAMTSNPVAKDYSFTIESSGLESGRLNRPGKVRVDKIYTLSQSIVIKSFGRVNSDTFHRIGQILRELIDMTTADKLKSDGRREGKIDVAKAMLAEGINISAIVRMTRLSESKIQELGRKS